jgi:hypothetical protein
LGHAFQGSEAAPAWEAPRNLRKPAGNRLPPTLQLENLRRASVSFGCSNSLASTSTSSKRRPSDSARAPSSIVHLILELWLISSCPAAVRQFIAKWDVRRSFLCLSLLSHTFKFVSILWGLYLQLLPVIYRKHILLPSLRPDAWRSCTQDNLLRSCGFSNRVLLHLDSLELFSSPCHCSHSGQCTT